MVGPIPLIPASRADDSNLPRPALHHGVINLEGQSVALLASARFTQENRSSSPNGNIEKSASGFTWQLITLTAPAKNAVTAAHGRCTSRDYLSMRRKPDPAGCSSSCQAGT